MNKRILNKIILLVSVVVVIIGGWFGESKLLELKEKSILSQTGQITEQSDKNEKNMNLPEENNNEKTFSGLKLSAGETREVLKIWETGKKIVPHDPLEGQMDMEQAITKGKEWLKDLQKNDCKFLTETNYEFDKTKAKLCFFENETKIQKEKIGFWEVTYKNLDIEIKLRIHALSGEVWSAEISMDENKARLQISDRELLGRAFPFLQTESNRVCKKGNISYMQNKMGDLYLLLRKSDMKISNTPPVVVLKLWIATKL